MSQKKLSRHSRFHPFNSQIINPNFLYIYENLKFCKKPFFQNGLNMKTSTPLVKISYIQCMLATFNSKTVTSISPLVPVLLKSVEKAASQPAVALSVTEGLCAAILLLRLAHSQQEKDSGLHNMWNVVLDMDKQIFVSDKFLTTCSEECK
nr:unnamed protein product [Callosobruchus analis]